MLFQLGPEGPWSPGQCPVHSFPSVLCLACLGGWALPEEGFVSIYRVLRPDPSPMQGVTWSTREESRGLEGGQVEQERRGRDLAQNFCLSLPRREFWFQHFPILGLLDLEGPV